MKKLIELLHKKYPESESQLLALVITFALWLVALAIGTFVPLGFLKKEAEPVYQSISLTLAPLSPASSQGLSQATSEPPTQEFTQAPSGLPPQAPAPAPEPLREPAPAAPVFPPAAPAPAQEPISAATSPATTGSFPAAPGTTAESAEPVDVDSFDEADWEALFAQGGSKTYSTANKKAAPERKGSSSSAGLSGSAAPTTTSTGTTSYSSSQNRGAGEQAPTQDTESALGRIATAASGEGNYSPPSGITASSSSDSGAGTQSATAMPLVGGGVRQLLYPSEPRITISEKNQSLVPGSVEVSIAFDITPQGLVLSSSIKITPESLVHPLVQAEIKEQIGKWSFQAAEGSGQVHFKYNIMKK